jgi:hypothetical protein
LACGARNRQRLEKQERETGTPSKGADHFSRNEGSQGWEPKTDAMFRPFPATPAMGVAMTTRQKRRVGIVKYCRTNNGRLVKNLSTKGRVEFWLEPSGVRVPEFQAHRAIFSGKLVRQDDGLFGNSQSWKAKPGKDALLHTDFNGAERIITNPPHSREPLHLLIEHLAGIAPSWLLIDCDWWHTRQAQPFAHLCTTIIPIGRLKWFSDSPHTGKDNFCWYRFDAKNKRPTIIHARTL